MAAKRKKELLGDTDVEKSIDINDEGDPGENTAVQGKVKKSKGTEILNPELGFDDAIKKLEELVGRLEKGDSPLEESLDVFEKAVEMVKYCNKKLQRAEERVRLLTRDDNGEILESAFGEK